MKVKGILSKTADAISGVPQDSVIVFTIYINDLPKYLSRDSLLYADGAKCIAPCNCHDIPQNSLNITEGWLKDWGLVLSPTKSEHLFIGHSPHFVTFSLVKDGADRCHGGIDHKQQLGIGSGEDQRCRRGKTGLQAFKGSQMFGGHFYGAFFR